MRVLITNDDGVRAPGIAALVREFTKFAEVVVAAPEIEQSGISHSITLRTPLFYDETEVGGIKAYSIRGYPADCVKLALDKLMSYEPDIVVSGINAGPNTGINVLYSGTVGAALEAALMGYPSVAVSLASYFPSDYGLAAETAVNIAKYRLKNDIPADIVLNVNVPNIESGAVQGIRWTFQGNGRFIDSYLHREDPRGKPYYWLHGKRAEKSSDLDEDDAAVASGWISVTPLKPNLTEFQLLKNLRDLPEPVFGSKLSGI